MEEVPRLAKGARRARADRTATQGMSIQGISKLTGWDRKTIRKYLLQPNAMPEYGPRPAMETMAKMTTAGTSQRGVPLLTSATS